MSWTRLYTLRSAIGRSALYSGILRNSSGIIWRRSDRALRVLATLSFRLMADFPSCGLRSPVLRRTDGHGLLRGTDLGGDFVRNSCCMAAKIHQGSGEMRGAAS